MVFLAIIVLEMLQKLQPFSSQFSWLNRALIHFVSKNTRFTDAFVETNMIKCSTHFIEKRLFTQLSGIPKGMVMLYSCKIDGTVHCTLCCCFHVSIGIRLKGHRCKRLEDWLWRHTETSHSTETKTVHQVLIYLFFTHFFHDTPSLSHSFWHNVIAAFKFDWGLDFAWVIKISNLFCSSFQPLL